MSSPFDDLTWVCHVCGDERPDGLIAVFKHHRVINGVEVQENIRYCTDRPGCVAMAAETHHIQGGQ